MTEIGYQHGIVAGMNGLRDLDPSKTLLKKVDGKWPSIDSLMVPLDQWKAWDKMERAFTILVADHDAAQGGSPDPPVDPPAQSYIRVAPITVTEQGGSNQRVCLFEGEVEGGPLRPGVTQRPDGRYTDEHPGGTIYQSNGLEDSSVRTRLPEGAFGLVKAREMDNRNACQCPPSGDPTKNTGSWTV